MSRRSFALALIVSAVGCASQPQRPAARPIPAAPSAAALASLNADLRIVNNETTWVTRGPGYELVGRTKADLLAGKAIADVPFAILHGTFPSDTGLIVVATIRREPAEGEPFIAAAPVPKESLGSIVELVLPNPRAARPNPSNSNGRGGRGGYGGRGENGPPPPPRNPALALERAWISAHATAVTKQPARFDWQNGETEDLRVHSWAQDMIPTLASDSTAHRFVARLAQYPDSLIPLGKYFTMDRPPMPFANVARSGGDEGRPPGGGGGGGMGGMGGGRGMGGRRGGGGMRGGGGEGGSGENRDENANSRAPLTGGELFLAQSAVLGEFFATRYGYPTIGHLVDAQLAGKTIDDAFTAEKIDGTRLELDWKSWLSTRATQEKK